MGEIKLDFLVHAEKKDSPTLFYFRGLHLVAVFMLAASAFPHALTI